MSVINPTYGSTNITMSGGSNVFEVASIGDSSGSVLVNPFSQATDFDQEPLTTKKRFRTPRRRELFNRVKNNFFAGLKIGVTAGNLGVRIHKAVVSTRKNLGNASETSKQANGVLKILSLVFLPFTFKDIYDGLKLLYTGDNSEKVDAAIDIATGVESLVSATSTFASLLADYGAIPAESVSWLTPLGFVSAGLSAISYAAHGKGLWDSYHFKKEINKLLSKSRNKEVSIEEFNDLMNYFEKIKNRKLASNLRVDSKKFKMRMKQVQEEINRLNQGTEEEQKIAKEGMMTTVKLIRKRIFKKQLKHGLSILATTVSLVGLIVLFTCPYSAPVAFSLLAFAGALSLGKLIYDYFETRKFRKDLGMREVKAEDYYGTPEKEGRDIKIKEIGNITLHRVEVEDDDED